MEALASETVGNIGNYGKRHLQFLQALAFARLGKLDELLAVVSSLSFAMATYYFHPQRAEYNEDHLREMARALENANGHADEQEMRVAASMLYCHLGYLIGTRWDPESEKVFALAETLDPNSAFVPYAQAAVALNQGDWATFDSLEVKEPNHGVLRQARQEFIHYDAKTSEMGDFDKPNYDVGSGPGPYREHAIARLLASSLSDSQKLDILRKNHQWVSDMDTIFIRVGRMIRFGESLGADTTQWKKQMSALQKMVKTQPGNTWFFSGDDGGFRGF